jgi:hypothetical protein
VNNDVIPIDVRRFLQANSLSVPHIETILLLRREPAKAWTYADVARRLYVTEERTSAFLTQLLALGVVQRSDEQASSYYYRPATPDLALLLDRLDVVYSKHLVAVTKLVHAARDQSAEQFAKAFQFRRES